MRKKHLLFSVVGLMFFVACNNESQPDTNKTIVCGALSNPAEMHILLTVAPADINNADTTILDESGNFLFEFSSQEPTYLYLSQGRKQLNLFVEPGDSIFISADMEKSPKTAKISGKGSEESIYLQNAFKERALFTLEEMDFRAKVDSVALVKSKMLDSFEKENVAANKSFIKTEAFKIECSKALDLIRYPRYHKYYAKKDELNLSKSFNDYQQNLDFNKANMLACKEYTSMLDGYLSMKFNEAVEKNPELEEEDNGYTRFNLEKSVELFTDQKVKNYMTYKVMNDHVKYYGIKKIETLLETFKQNNTNPSMIAKVEAGIKKWEKVAPGKEAPVFQYPTIEGEMISLADFKGKYVYIDVWATWCGPCRREIPAMKEIIEDFSGKNIAFVAVSVDADKGAWEKMLTEEGSHGIQLIADKAWDSKITGDYLIRSIPRFILIDREGKIIDVNAPRPSSGIREVLDGMEGI